LRREPCYTLYDVVFFQAQESRIFERLTSNNARG
jgi:hypothetical protein